MVQHLERIPLYFPRKPGELRAALKWGVATLRLRDWDIKLLLDKACQRMPRKMNKKLPAAASIHIATRSACIGINRKICETGSMHVDPIYALFHELCHVACWLFRHMGKDSNDLEEQLVHTFAHVLYRLWERRDYE